MNSGQLSQNFPHPAGQVEGELEPIPEGSIGARAAAVRLRHLGRLHCPLQSDRLDLA